MQQELQRARPLLAKSRAVLRSDKGSLSPAHKLDLAHAEAGLGLDHLRRQQYAEAESLLTAAHSTYESFYGGISELPHPLLPVRRLRSRLAQLYDAWGQPEKAEAYRERTSPPAGDHRSS
jgi:hypothetical protein